MNDKDHEKEKEHWASLIGRLMLAFGNIEFQLCRCLVEIPEVSRHEELINHDFKKRATQAIKEIENAKLDKANSKKLINLLNECIKLAKKRNLIAHNPFNLSFYDTKDGLGFRLEIVSLRNNDIFLEIGELESLVNKAEKYADELYVVGTDITFGLYPETT